MDKNTITGPKHTRYTILARIATQCVLRTSSMEDKPSKNRDYTRDSIAVTVVCHRPGRNQGEVELLAILYENGGRGKTFRFPTETGEQELQETPEMVARACLYQEVLVSDGGHIPEIGRRVLENVRQSDCAHRPRPHTTEILSAPEWVEASELMDRMLSRGIQSHRNSLCAVIGHLASTDKSVAVTYARKLSDWGAYT